MIGTLLSRLGLGPRARKVTTLVAGVMIGHLAILLATPLLSRLFTPADFGLYAMFAAMLGMLAPVSSLRFELAIPIPRSQEDAWHVLTLSSGVAGCLALATGLSIAWFPNQMAAFAGVSQQSSWVLWALPAGLLLSGVQQSLNFWHVRNEQFITVSQSRGGLGVTTASTQVALGSLAMGPAGLITGEVLGRAVACIWLAIRIPRSQARQLIRTVSATTLVASALRFRKFALLSAPSALANAAGLYLPVIVIGNFFSSEAAGLLLLAQRVAGLKTGLLVGSASQVFVAEFARATNANDRSRIYKSTIKRYALLTGPLFLAVGLVSPVLFPWLFGSAWTSSGILVLALTPFYFCQLLSGSTISALDVMQTHWVRLGRELVLAIGTGSILTVGVLYDLSLLAAVCAYVAFGILFYGLSLILVHHVISRSESD